MIEQFLRASVQPEVRVHPNFKGDPNRAALRNPRQPSTIFPDKGVIVGFASRCFACLQWINDLELISSRKEGLYDSAYGTWICDKCVSDQRPLVTPATKTPGSTKRREAIPTEYADATILDLPKELQSTARKWPKSLPVLIVCGRPGSGKTRLTWAYVKAAAQQERPILRILAPKAQLDYQSCQYSYQRAELFRKWTTAPYLIIDDFSACEADDSWIRLMQLILDQRLWEETQRPTLITTAAGADELEKLYDVALHSRLLAAEWLFLPETDYREDST